MDSQGTYVSMSRLVGENAGINATPTGDKFIFGPFQSTTSAVIQSFAVLITQVTGTDNFAFVLKRNGVNITSPITVSNINTAKSVRRFNIAQFLTDPQNRKVNEGDIITVSVTTASAATLMFIPILDVG